MRVLISLTAPIQELRLCDQQRATSKNVFPFIFTKTSFRCHYQFECRPALFLRISCANFDPNWYTQKQTVSWQISIPRSCKMSYTWWKINA